MAILRRPAPFQGCRRRRGQNSSAHMGQTPLSQPVEAAVGVKSFCLTEREAVCAQNVCWRSQNTAPAQGGRRARLFLGR